MGSETIVVSAALLFCLSLAVVVHAGDPYVYHTWRVKYGNISPLGVPVQGILINGKFPGPTINCTSNNNIVVNVFNDLDEPLLLTWNGIQQRRRSWIDGTAGTMCPIQPGTNFTYEFQVKDQIGTFFYFPTTALHRASGGMGQINIHSRAQIPVPFDRPAEDFQVMAGDWYNKGHKTLKRLMDSGRSLAMADGLQINGQSVKVGQKADPLFIVEKGKTYRFRVCNVGLKTTFNMRFQEHDMKLVEMEGSHTIQNMYDSLDVHVGQCLSVLVTFDKEPKDYYMVITSRFTKKKVLTGLAIIRYKGSNTPASDKIPTPPPENKNGIAWSINQFRSFRWNLTASAARPNPQGSYHYGKINITRTIKLVNAKARIEGKVRYVLNGVSHVDATTPLKLAEYFGVQDKVFKYDIMKDEPTEEQKGKALLGPNVVKAKYRNFVEIIFENREKTIQTYHLDGYAFFAVGMEPGRWAPEKRKNYNLIDAVSRSTIQVYPGSWAAVMTTLDNAGMWNLRSEMWHRAYLGQQMYFSVLSPDRRTKDEYNIFNTTMLCGIVKDMPRPATYT